MLASQKLALAPLLFVFLVICQDVRAYVVISDLSVGDDALGIAVNGSDSENERATGELDDDDAELANGVSLVAPSRRPSSQRSQPGEKSSGGNRQTYPSSNRSAAGGSGGGAGGGGGRGQSVRRQASSNLVPMVVAEESSRSQVADKNQGIESDVTVFDIEDDASGVASGGSSSGGGGGIASSSDPDYADTSDTNPQGGGSRLLTGTPEPSALAVWAIAGIFGYGLIRLNRS